MNKLDVVRDKIDSLLAHNKIHVSKKGSIEPASWVIDDNIRVLEKIIEIIDDESMTQSEIRRKFQ